MSACRDERGSALLSAMAMLGMMMLLGLATVALTDGQGRESQVERVREASLGATEAALDAQIDRFSGTWPSTAAAAFPAECSTATPVSLRCPDPAALQTSLSGSDNVSAGCAAPDWRTQVRDNGGGATNVYRSTVVPTQPTYDANADGLMWVRAEGRARCRLRTLVTLVRANVVTLPFPRTTIGANWFWSTNQGRKVVVDTLGAYAQPPSVRPDKATAQPAPIAVRCTPPFPTPCLKVQANKGQVSGSTPQTNSTLQSPALAGEQLELVKSRARSLGTYFVAGGPCPTTLTGELVYVEDLTGCPGYPGGNDKNAPGMLVIGKGTLTLTGNRAFYGMVYARNEQGTSGAVVQTQGTSLIQGSVVVDGLGGVIAGSSSTNVVFDPRVSQLVRGLGDAARVLGSWRELAPGE